MADIASQTQAAPPPWSLMTPDAARAGGAAADRGASGADRGQALGREERPQTVRYDGVFGDDGMSFDDVLDSLNPLQHIPVVATIYRELTGDEISTGSRLAGGTLFGGAIGLAGAIADSVSIESTGRDLGSNALAFLFGEEAGDPGTAVADAGATATDDVGAAGAATQSAAASAAPQPVRVAATPSAAPSPVTQAASDADAATARASSAGSASILTGETAAAGPRASASGSLHTASALSAVPSPGVARTPTAPAPAQVEAPAAEAGATAAEAAPETANGTDQAVTAASSGPSPFFQSLQGSASRTVEAAGTQSEQAAQARMQAQIQGGSGATAAPPGVVATPPQGPPNVTRPAAVQGSEQPPAQASADAPAQAPGQPPAPTGPAQLSPAAARVLMQMAEQSQGAAAPRGQQNQPQQIQPQPQPQPKPQASAAPAGGSGDSAAAAPADVEPTGNVAEAMMSALQKYEAMKRNDG